MRGLSSSPVKILKQLGESCLSREDKVEYRLHKLKLHYIMMLLRSLCVILWITATECFMSSGRLQSVTRKAHLELNMGLFNKSPKIRDGGYDFVIVGGGTAGCVLANRLSADENVNVLMIEAGTAHYNSPLIRIPAGILKLFQNEKFDWIYHSEKDRSNNNRGVYLCRGKVLGGSSCTNVLLYHRGSEADYKEWENATNDKGWSADHVLPYFKKSQDDFRGDSKYHSTGGEFAVDEVRYQNPLSRVFLQACGEHGLTHNDDFNNWARPQEGYGRYQVNERDGTRCSAASGFLKPVQKRRNLHIVTETMVDKILVDEHKCVTGVKLHTGEIASLANNGEVLLSGGAINSPQLLMLSGIGPREHLEAHGVDVVHDLPGVGQNLQDHPAIVTSYACKDEQAGISVTSKIRVKGTTLTNPKVALQWLFKKKGPLTSTGCDHGGFFKTKVELSGADLQMRFLAARALSPDGMGTFTKFREQANLGDGYSFQSIVARPTSRGSVKLRSSDPREKPIIDGGHVKTEEDMATLREGIRMSRTLGTSPAFAPYMGEEVYPGTHIQSDAEIDEYIRETVHTSNALVGTCKMGAATDAHAVVDSHLKVLGVKNLRVVDASVMPKIIGGQTSAPTIMIAERASDLLLSARS